MGMIGRDLLASVRLILFDFDGVFTDNTVYVSQQGIESVRCWRSDGLGLSRLRGLGVGLSIVSTEANPVVQMRAAKLKLPCLQGVEDKAVAVLQLCQESGVAPAQTMFVGNDINDIPAFQTVGVSVAVADAYPEVDQYVMARTTRRGGLGAVREVCDWVYFAKSGGQVR